MTTDVRRLVLLRHGRTAWNHEGRAQGLTDVDLDDVGHEQAQAAGAVLAALEPDAIWTSDLRRARHTACHVGEACGGLVPRIDHRLREFDVGERTGLTLAEYASTSPDEAAAFAAGGFDSVPGTEPASVVAERTGAALDRVLEGLAVGRTHVVVGHGASLKVALLGLLDWPLQVAATLRGLENCHWVELESDGLDRPFRMTAYNRGVAPARTTRLLAV